MEPKPHCHLLWSCGAAPHDTAQKVSISDTPPSDPHTAPPDPFVVMRNACRSLTRNTASSGPSLPSLRAKTPDFLSGLHKRLLCVCRFCFSSRGTPALPRHLEPKRRTPRASFFARAPASHADLTQTPGPPTSIWAKRAKAGRIPPPQTPKSALRMIPSSKARRGLTARKKQAGARLHNPEGTGPQKRISWTSKRIV